MAQQDPLVGKVLAERFEILERIGEGGTGVVYKAKQLSVDRIIAIKVLGAHVSTDPQWVKRFHNEARAASRLDHPNTVRLIDFGQTREGLLFIAMEYLHGRSLRAEIDRVKRLPPNRVLWILSQICGSLSEAHNQGIIHRDIKPDNIYLVEMKGAGDLIKVLDFSVAKMDAPDAQATRVGVVFGTPAYMSPEQGRGIPLDRRSDIYAIGIVAYEMLNGKPPFDAKAPTEVVMMHLRETPPPLQGVPPRLVQVVMRALEKDPSRRQQTAEELDAECQSCMADLFPGMTPGGGVRQSAPPASQPVGEMKTMMPTAAPAPVARPSAAEMKTMMAQGGAAPPASSHAQDMKTMMAPGSAAAAPGAAQARPEQRTMIGAQTPMAGFGPPPPAPPPGADYPPPAAAPVSQGITDQKTMMAEARPPAVSDQRTQMQQAQQQRTQMAQAQQQRTQINAQGPRSTGAGIPVGGTQLLPDSQGVIAFAREQAERARETVGTDVQPAAPAGVLFWLAWVVVGIGGGLAIHFFLAQRAAQLVQ